MSEAGFFVLFASALGLSFFGYRVWIGFRRGYTYLRFLRLDHDEHPNEFELAMLVNVGGVLLSIIVPLLFAFDIVLLRV
jgi:hypothetical protein